MQNELQVIVMQEKVNELNNLLHIKELNLLFKYLRVFKK